MTKEMIISSNDHETRVAILEDDLVAELFVERERQRGVVGNIYKGRVSKVLPGMQSAFVDIGLERDGFLYVSDVAQDPATMDDADESGEGEGNDEPDAPREGSAKGDSRGGRGQKAEDKGGRRSRTAPRGAGHPHPGGQERSGPRARD
jgi:ribonuclease G